MILKDTAAGSLGFSDSLFGFWAEQATTPLKMLTSPEIRPEGSYTCSPGSTMTTGTYPPPNHNCTFG